MPLAVDYLPPLGVGALCLFFSVLLVYFGWTMGTIAYGAWGAEASGDYAERTRITGVREMFALLGILIASLAPLFTPGGCAWDDFVDAGHTHRRPQWAILELAGGEFPRAHWQCGKSGGGDPALRERSGTG
ncbi:MAG: MFS transporter [Alphaproteobacteria bacterium]|nr:MFS transporter [Alphaproteobacteria bacterium]